MLNDHYINELETRLDLRGQEWAETKAEYSRLSRKEKPLLAALRKSSDSTTVAGKDNDAYDHPEYAKFEKEIHEAFLAYLKAQATYDLANTFIELKRSQESTERKLL